MLKEFNLNEMTVKDIVRLMMVGSGYETFKEIAEKQNIPPSTLQYALDKNSLRVRDFQAIADLLGYEIKLEKKEKE